MRGGAEPTARGRGGPPGGPGRARPRPEPRRATSRRPGTGCPGGAPPLEVHHRTGAGSGGRGPEGLCEAAPQGAPTRTGTGWAGQAGRRLGGVRRGGGPDSGPDTRPARYRGRWCGAAGRGVRSRTCPGACQRPRRGSTPDRGPRTPPSPAPTSTPHTAYDLRFPPPLDPSTDPPRRPKSVAGFHGPAMRPPRVRRDPPPLSARGARSRGVPEGPGRPSRPVTRAGRVFAPRAPAARRGPVRAPAAYSPRAGTPRRRPCAATPHGPPADRAGSRSHLARAAPSQSRRARPSGLATYRTGRPGSTGTIRRRQSGHPWPPAGDPA